MGRPASGPLVGRPLEDPPVTWALFAIPVLREDLERVGHD